MSEWKQTEIGIIPFDWKIQSSSIYCKKITDGTHDSPKSATSGYPLITSKHIKDSLIDFKEAYLVSEEDYQAIIKRSKVEQYDLIISMIGEYCGFTYLEMNQEVNYAIKNVGLFKNKSLTAAKWLKYYLDSPIGKHQLRLRRSGTSQPYISLGALRELPIITPSSEDERKKIVDILSCLDNKIDNLRRQNETLEKIAQTLFKHWFIDFEFPNDDGKPYKSSGGAMVASELGDIPEGWRVGKLGEVAKNHSQTYNFKDKEKIIFINTGDVLNGDFLHNEYVSISNLPGQAKKMIAKEDILYSEIRPINKRFTYVNFDSNNYVVSTKFMIVRANHLILPRLLYLILKRQDTIQEFQKIAESRSGTFPQITFESVSNFDLVIPSIDVQRQLMPLLTLILEKQEFNIKHIKTIIQTRDALLPKLMSGQIRVKEGESLIEE
jgi:type I restriction enzyme S subunit